MRKNNQTGRSMVEMLGVLAIIGVLSVGAIAGYSKAMFKYKLNKHAQQLNQIISTGLRYKGHFLDAKATDNDIVVLDSFFIKLNEIPKEMIKDDDIYDVFGTKIYYYYYPKESKTAIFFLVPNKDDMFSMDICKNLMVVTKEYAGNIMAVTAISGSSSGNYDTSVIYYGDSYCSQGNKCLSTMSMTDIDNMCRTNLKNSFSPHFKIEYDD